MRYSATTNGFYSEKRDYPNLPDDIVTIDDGYHALLIEQQSNGYIITSDDNGYPIAYKPPELTPEHELELWRSQTSIKKVQAWLNLQAKGYLQTVIDKMNTLPITDPLRIVWEHSESYSRNDIRLIEFCVDELGLTSEQIDALFIVQ